MTTKSTKQHQNVTRLTDHTYHILPRKNMRTMDRGGGGGWGYQGRSPGRRGGVPVAQNHSLSTILKNDQNQV